MIQMLYFLNINSSNGDFLAMSSDDIKVIEQNIATVLGDNTTQKDAELYDAWEQAMHIAAAASGLKAGNFVQAFYGDVIESTVKVAAENEADYPWILADA